MHDQHHDHDLDLDPVWDDFHRHGPVADPLWAELQACPALPHGRQAAREAIVAGVAVAAVLGVLAIVARVLTNGAVSP